MPCRGRLCGAKYEDDAVALNHDVVNVAVDGESPEFVWIENQCIAFRLNALGIVADKVADVHPERVLEYLLPTFKPIARVLGPITAFAAHAIASAKRNGTAATPDEAAEEANEVAKAYIDTAEQEWIIQGEERRLLQSIVDFGDMSWSALVSWR